MNSRIRPFEMKDLEPLIRLQNSCMPEDSLTCKGFTKKVLLDINYNPEGCLVAEADDLLVGFILGLRRSHPLEDSPDDSDRSWITLCFVHPEYRRQGIGTRLLHECESYLETNPCKSIWISPYAPNYFIPGVDVNNQSEALEFFKANGYQEVMRPLSMDANLLTLKTPDWVIEKQKDRESEGYQFIFYNESWTLPFLRHLRVCFPGDWQRFAREKMTGIMDGRNQEDEVVLAVQKDRVVGFAQHENSRFGPFGVDENLRGKGIGMILLFKVLHQMRAKGYHDAWFLWTEDRTARLYSIAGFKESRRFVLLKKVIS